MINSLDKQAQAVFAQKDLKIAKVQDLSFLMFGIIIVFAIILLLISFLIICSDLRKEKRIKYRLNQVISENEELLEMRKRIILTVSHGITDPGKEETGVISGGYTAFLPPYPASCQ